MRHHVRTLALIAFMAVVAVAALAMIAQDSSADTGAARSRTDGPVEKAFDPDTTIEYEVTYYIDFGNRTIRMNHSKSGDMPDKWQVRMYDGENEIDRNRTFEIEGGSSPKTVTIRYTVRTYDLNVDEHKGYTLTTRFWCDILDDGEDSGKDSNITQVRSIIAEKDDAAVEVEAKYHNKRISLTGPTSFPLLIKNTGWKDDNDVNIMVGVVDSPEHLWAMQVLPSDHIYGLDSLETDDTRYIEITGDPLLTTGTYTIKVEIFIGNGGYVNYTFPVQAPPPELWVYDLIPSHTTALTNDEITITAVITNDGGYVDTVEVQFFVQVPGGPLRPFGTKVINGLKSRGLGTVRATYSNDELYLKREQNATLVFSVRIDPLGKVPLEEDRTNNEDSTSVNVFNMPRSKSSFASGPYLMLMTLGTAAVCALIADRKRRTRTRQG